jgi:HAD superfamily hydrolase (TIGR01509 family)
MQRAVISDLGNVILWFNNELFYRKMAAHCRLSVDEICGIVWNSPEFVELFDLGRLTPREFYDRVTAKLGAGIGYDDFMAAYVDVFSINPPVFETMKRLKDKHRLVLVSNVDQMRFGFIKRRFPEIMFFDEYVLSYELGVMKPDARIYRVALDKAGAAAGDCVFIDDMEENIEGAVALGISGILYRPDTDLEKELRASGICVA